MFAFSTYHYLFILPRHTLLLAPHPMTEERYKASCKQMSWGEVKNEGVPPVLLCCHRGPQKSQIAGLLLYSQKHFLQGKIYYLSISLFQQLYSPVGYAGGLLFSPLVPVRIHINTETYTEERQHLYDHRILGREGILKLVCFQLPCHDEAHILPDQAAHFCWRGQQK